MGGQSSIDMLEYSGEDDQAKSKPKPGEAKKEEPKGNGG